MKFAGMFLFVSLAFGQRWVAQNGGSGASLRGVAAAGRSIVWASGTSGTWLRSVDGGDHWQSGAVPGADNLDFRGAFAFDENNAWLMSSGPRELSAVYRTVDGGRSWSQQFTAAKFNWFFDAIAFWDAKNGMVIGDPDDGSFVALVTGDGAQTWQVRQAAAIEGEGVFAASNSALVLRGASEAWFATGGIGGARVFHSIDYGKHWTVVKTPLRDDANGSGIFSLALGEGNSAIAVGGDYSKPGERKGNIAISADAGQTWIAPAGTPPRGFRSAVAWLPEHKLWVTTGPTGSEYSRDGGQNWVPFDDGAFNAIAVGGRDSCWAVGPKERIARLELDGAARR